ncbi:MAG: transporter ATP-binding protein [Rhodospirillales bacterium]|jgi:ABC-2 type transport system ATP-binding protein|nr:transporter ATP-binding protein [Rhodospirillales bacterium]
MIEVKRLAKHFGPIVAVDDVSFTVRRGEVLGFLGPNGAGKSTTMKMITGFLAPSSGTAIVCGADVTRDPIAVKRRIGYLPEGAPAYPDMTSAGFLDFIAHIRGFSGAEARRRVALAVERVDLGDVLYQPIETLSKGFKRRVGLAQALLHDPDVLIMDEPTDGLDPNQKHQVRRLIAEMSADKAIIISTHLLEEVDAVCSRAMIIAHGKLLADGTPGALEARSRYHNAVRLVLAPADQGPAAAAIRLLPGVDEVESLAEAEGDALMIIPLHGSSIIGSVGDLLRNNRWEPTAISVERGRLDDVFRQITTAH